MRIVAVFQIIPAYAPMAACMAACREKFLPVANATMVGELNPRKQAKTLPGARLAIT
jgi:hypothetical protein